MGAAPKRPMTPTVAGSVAVTAALNIRLVLLLLAGQQMDKIGVICSHEKRERMKNADKKRHRQ